MSPVSVAPTPLRGMRVITSAVHRDARGWFTQAWSAADLAEHGIAFTPVQHNLSLNLNRGTTRGIHAEPWNKLITVASGRVFGAWVDLREGPDFGRCWWRELTVGEAVLVPQGVGNAFQALEPETVYSYLVDAPWRPAAEGAHPAVDLADPRLAIPWPIDLAAATLSAADRGHPALSEVAALPDTPDLSDAPVTAEPVAPSRSDGSTDQPDDEPEPGHRHQPTRERARRGSKRLVILGSGGLLGQALAARFPEAVLAPRGVDLGGVDLGRSGWAARGLAGLSWDDIDTVVNAAAYTQVDRAESPLGRQECWQVNAHAVSELVRRAGEHGVRVVQISTDYVFDGTQEVHPEDEPVSPLGVYGASKAAADLAVSALERHLVVRTSWLVGAGRGFVAAMVAAARADRPVQVVDDQVGRVTFVDELAAAIAQLLAADEQGTVNVSAAGPALDRAALARWIFELLGRDPSRVAPVSSQAYAAGALTAPRPRHSTLSLDRLRRTGFTPTPWPQALEPLVLAERAHKE